jgi:hypothetical protein
MTDPTHNPPKKLSGLMAGRTFTVEKKYVPGSYEHYVHLTSKLIGRSYMATHKLVEQWPVEKIIERYELCTKHAGTMPGDVKWWWLRKTENSHAKG